MDARLEFQHPGYAASRVALGLTVYNGARYLPQALEALLAQDYPDYSIVALDDASTDESLELLVRAAEACPRLVVFSRTRRRGMIRAWKDVFHLAKAVAPGHCYFAWCSDHDQVEPQWLGALVRELECDPKAVLAYPLTGAIDAEGASLDAGEAERLDRFEVRDTPDPSERFLQVSRGGKGYGAMVYGLIRSDAIAPAGVFRRVLAPDRLLIHELSLAGEIRQLPRILRRQRALASATAQRQRSRLFEPDSPAILSYLPWGLTHAGALWWNRTVTHRSEAIGSGEISRLAIELMLAPSRRSLLGLRKSAIRLGLSLAEQRDALETLLGAVRGEQWLRERRIARLEHSLAEDPLYARGWSRLAELAAERGDPDAEIGVWRRRLEVEPGDQNARTMIVRRLLDAGRPADAIEHLAVLAEQEDGPDGWRRLARAYAELGRTEEEIDVWRRRLAVDPADRNARNMAARRLTETGRTAEAVEHLAVLAELEGEADGWRRLARAFAELGRSEDETAAWRRMLELAPDDANAHDRLYRLASRARPAEALIHAKALAAAPGSTPSDWARVAGLCARLGDVAGEIEALERRGEAGDDATPLWRLVRLKVEVGRAGEAAAELERFADQHPGNTRAWRELIGLYARAGDVENELRVRERMLEAFPDDLSARRTLLRRLLERDRIEDALGQARILAAAPGAGAADCAQLARLCVRAGDAAGEIEAMQRALQLDAQPTLRLKLAQLLLGCGRADEAADQLEAVMASRPADQKTRRWLDQLYEKMPDSDRPLRAWAGWLDAHPEDEAVRARLCRRLLGQGRFGEATPHLIRSLSAARDRARLLRQLARDHEPGSRLWRDLAAAARAVEDEDLELQLLMKMETKEAPDAKLARRIARLLVQNDRPAEALPRLWTLARNEPEEPRAWRTLIGAARKAKDAKAELGALSEMPDALRTPADRLRTAQLLFAIGRDDAAERQVHAALSADGDAVRAWTLLGQSLDALVEREAAARAWQRLLVFDRRSAEAKQGFKRLGATSVSPREPAQGYDARSFAALHGGADVDAVAAERTRLDHLLEAWSLARRLAPSERSGVAEAVLEALLARVDALVSSADIGEPFAMAARCEALQAIGADPRFVDLVEESPERYAQFLLGADRPGADQNAALDPLWRALPDRAASAAAGDAGPGALEIHRQRTAASGLMWAPAFERPVLICGFHHSGTRLVAQLLGELGVYQHVNTHSFEWNYIQGINTGLLPGWARPELIEQFDAEAAVLPSAEEIARRLALSGYAGDGAWGLKDPRNSVTAEAWLRRFPRLRIVNVLRNPMDVLGTLPAHYAQHTPGKTKPQREMAFWAALWNAYLDRTRAAMRQAAQSHELRFEDLCGDPQAAIAALRSALDLDGTMTLEAGRIDPGRVGAHRRWLERGDLTEDELEVAKALARANGYDA